MIKLKEIKSRDNKIIKYLLRLNSNSSFRSKEKKFLCEGLRLCTEAVISGVEVEAVFLRDDSAEKYTELLERIPSAELYLLSKSLFKLIAETSTPQGVALLCKINRFDAQLRAASRIVALETIQNPENMGTILRTAEAFGIDQVILSKDCCDIFSPKVLRGSMGAVFRQRITIPEDFYDTITYLKSSDITVCAAVPHGGKDIKTLDFSKRCCVIIGNEGNGLTDRAIELCSTPVTIKMDGNAESLNAAVAASIIMWEMVRGCSE